ncbi:unnamed protein product [Closterium sp. Naga37s-1]|nr:unnamed protein product [Closterium sp. Naga37s-1]
MQGFLEVQRHSVILSGRTFTTFTLALSPAPPLGARLCHDPLLATRPRRNHAGRLEWGSDRWAAVTRGHMTRWAGDCQDPHPLLHGRTHSRAYRTVSHIPPPCVLLINALLPPSPIPPLPPQLGTYFSHADFWSTDSRPHGTLSHILLISHCSFSFFPFPSLSPPPTYALHLRLLHPRLSHTTAQTRSPQCGRTPPLPKSPTHAPNSPIAITFSFPLLFLSQALKLRTCCSYAADVCPTNSCRYGGGALLTQALSLVLPFPPPPPFPLSSHQLCTAPALPPLRTCFSCTDVGPIHPRHYGTVSHIPSQKPLCCLTLSPFSPFVPSPNPSLLQLHTTLHPHSSVLEAADVAEVHDRQAAGEAGEGGSAGCRAPWWFFRTDEQWENEVRGTSRGGGCVVRGTWVELSSWAGQLPPPASLTRIHIPFPCICLTNAIGPSFPSLPPLFPTAAVFPPFPPTSSPPARHLLSLFQRGSAAYSCALPSSLLPTSPNPFAVMHYHLPLPPPPFLPPPSCALASRTRTSAPQNSASPTSLSPASQCCSPLFPSPPQLGACVAYTDCLAHRLAPLWCGCTDGSTVEAADVAEVHDRLQAELAGAEPLGVAWRFLFGKTSRARMGCVVRCPLCGRCGAGRDWGGLAETGVGWASLGCWVPLGGFWGGASRGRRCVLMFFHGDDQREKEVRGERDAGSAAPATAQSKPPAAERPGERRVLQAGRPQLIRTCSRALGDAASSAHHTAPIRPSCTHLRAPPCSSVLPLYLSTLSPK